MATETKSVSESILEFLQMTKEGTYSRSDAAVLITRDAVTGIFTFSYHGVDDKEGQKVFAEAARLKGFMRSV